MSIDRSMGWDPAVLRKYNITGHFRLLNQLRGELHTQPLERSQGSKSSRSSRSSSRTLEVRPQAYARNRRQGFSPSASTAVTPSVEAAGAANEQDLKPSSFRDRLNAIEMC